MLPNTVAKEDYAAAISLTSATYQLAIILGALVGGGLIGLIGAGGALGFNAITFVASAIALTRLHDRHEPAGRERRASVADGWRAVTRDPLVRRAIISYSLFGASAIVAESLVPVYVLERLRESQSATGLVMATIPLGTLATTVLLPTRGEPQALLRRTALVGGAASAVALAGFAVAPGLPWVLAAFLVCGAVFAAGVPANAVMGLRIPDEVRASAFGVLSGMLQGALAGSAALGGLAASHLGVRRTMLIALAASVVGAGALLATARLGDSRDVEADRAIAQ
jgi:predicted MFS family arabinose efflux permease